MEDYSMFIPNVHFEQIPIKNLVSNQEYQRNLSESHIQGKSRYVFRERYQPHCERAKSRLTWLFRSYVDCIQQKAKVCS